jgi:hypothetical protein
MTDRTLFISQNAAKRAVAAAVIDGSLDARDLVRIQSADIRQNDGSLDKGFLVWVPRRYYPARRGAFYL